MTTPESKEATHERFYSAFHDWFMQSGCDFWSECDAPEELATLAVELSDAFARVEVARERERMRAAIFAVRDKDKRSLDWCNALNEAMSWTRGGQP